jgi:hypothetical protein
VSSWLSSKSPPWENSFISFVVGKTPTKIISPQRKQSRFRRRAGNRGTQSQAFSIVCGLVGSKNVSFISSLLQNCCKNYKIQQDFVCHEYSVNRLESFSPTPPGEIPRKSIFEKTVDSPLNSLLSFDAFLSENSIKTRFSSSLHV